jgi:hypothetical protein
MNTYKKQDADGNQLSEQIGKGLNIKHTNKVLKERNSFISVRAGNNKKKLYKDSCEMLGISQADEINKVIDKIILKASKL